MVTPEDPVALRAAVEKLVGDPQLARELGENGRRYVKAHFDRKVIAGRFVELLRETARR